MLQPPDLGKGLPRHPLEATTQILHLHSLLYNELEELLHFNFPNVNGPRLPRHLAKPVVAYCLVRLASFLFTTHHLPRTFAL